MIWLKNILHKTTFPPMPMPLPRGIPQMNDAAFFAEYRRQFGGSLDQHTVDGINFILGDCAKNAWGMGWTAYALATAKWETANTYQPVREAYWKSEEWRRRNLRYYPWYGRGYVQLTWRRNYEAMKSIVGKDLIGDKDLALDPDIAGDIMIQGMSRGTFTGKKLGDYMYKDDKGTLTNFISARRIINGTDKARQIANIAVKLQNCLEKAEWGTYED